MKNSEPSLLYCFHSRPHGTAALVVFAAAVLIVSPGNLILRRLSSDDVGAVCMHSAGFKHGACVVQAHVAVSKKMLSSKLQQLTDAF